MVYRQCALMTVSLFYCRHSASCVHVSSLLHALVALKQVEQALSASSDESENEADDIPVTSRACAWKAPRKRKAACLKISDVLYEYGKV